MVNQVSNNKGGLSQLLYMLGFFPREKKDIKVTCTQYQASKKYL